MSGKPVAFITGANQGIGLQVAHDLARHDFIVLMGARNFEQGQDAARGITGDAHAIQIDVTDRASVTAAAARVHHEFGRLDVLIQNAAISNTSKKPGQTVEEYAQTIKASVLNLDEMRSVWETNVFGVLHVYQAMVPLLRATPGSRIVNVSSGAGSLEVNSDASFPWRPIFGPIYPASKTALNALTLAMAIEMEAEGIPVNAVSPGFTKTNLNAFQGTDSSRRERARS